jgi:methylated-DNA-protein-cysteine methyltransferase-like protein
VRRDPSALRARIYRVVSRIPRGRVATYGQVAALAGIRGHARQVGYALHALPPRSRVPWHRVINARGGVSSRSLPGADALQRVLLRSERVTFDREGRVDLARFGWRPRPGAATPTRAAPAIPPGRRARA